MARLVNNTVSTETAIKMITHFEDNTSVEKMIRINDTVENLRYIEDEELKSISGIVSKIGTNISRVTGVKLNKPVDNFAKDVSFRLITVDASEHFESNLVSFPVKEIVEDEGTVNVTKIDFIPYPIVTMDMEYTDGLIKKEELVVGDVLDNMVIIGSTVITGAFKIAAMYYVANRSLPEIKGLYLVPIEGGKAFKIDFDQVISFDKKTSTTILDDSSLKSISEALAEAEDGIVYATLGVDVEIPPRPDGKITTTLISEGQELNVDLAGHSITTQAYAFYVNGGTLNIVDSTGSGVIGCTRLKDAYPAVYVASSGTCNMESGIIDTTLGGPGTDENPNWMYGVVCSGDGVFNMTGGKIITQAAAGISITNGTASGVGAQFIISGDAEITAKDCCAIYLADNKSVDICGKAKINGGIVARMGDITVRENATVNGFSADTEIYPLGKLVCESGCEKASAPILALTGCYKSDLGNDMNIRIEKTARVNAYIDHGVDIATINTKYDQKVVVDIESEKSFKVPTDGALYYVYNHAELAELAADQGKTLAPETTTTDLTIMINGVPVDGSEEEPEAPQEGE